MVTEHVGADEAYADELKTMRHDLQRPRCEDCGGPPGLCPCSDDGWYGDLYDGGTEYYYGRPVETVVLRVGNAAIL